MTCRHMELRHEAVATIAAKCATIFRIMLYMTALLMDLNFLAIGVIVLSTRVH